MLKLILSRSAASVSVALRKEIIMDNKKRFKRVAVVVTAAAAAATLSACGPLRNQEAYDPKNNIDVTLYGPASYYDEQYDEADNIPSEGKSEEFSVSDPAQN